MSKADKLRASASFARAQPVSSRRAAIAAATGVATDGVAPPTQVPRSALAHNPFNVREQLTDLEETAASLKEKGQLQPLAVVTRGAFLAVHPGQEEAIGSAQYVVIDGNRRLGAADLAGIERLQIYINDQLAASSEDILEAALIANIHRVDVAPLDQARAVQSLLATHGSQEKVAQRLGKSGAWVSQRLALLELPEDLQEKVEAGELKVRDGRRIGRLPADQQHAEAERVLNRVKAPRAPRKAAPEPASGVSPGADGTTTEHAAGERHSPTVALTDPGVPAQAPAPETLNPVNAAPGIPVQDNAWHDPSWVADQVHKRMSPENRERLIELLLAPTG
ncbi:ParB/RepB/Spo0J family partition protein [Streptomyces sp. PTM05]|uniref:ParB/RepB/Spo0J family partition protein n=1 Tax=Streptantibioticus parmotrematis TaxID=2873249 RepID=A0ABS7R2A0_9ACTN|nr:ParB/RepB/Spo0J family partition protein [Streptantibioticus parmotrematis]MBY8889081.1 ParB/RepB/Spo0J family partition protein [Streptantibioticus parmotrematis]